MIFGILGKTSGLVIFFFKAQMTIFWLSMRVKSL